jgi:hypothetical protein
MFAKFWERIRSLCWVVGAATALSCNAADYPDGYICTPNVNPAQCTTHTPLTDSSNPYEISWSVSGCSGNSSKITSFTGVGRCRYSCSDTKCYVSYDCRVISVNNIPASGVWRTCVVYELESSNTTMISMYVTLCSAGVAFVCAENAAYDSYFRSFLISTFGY